MVMHSCAKHSKIITNEGKKKKEAVARTRRQAKKPRVLSIYVVSPANSAMLIYVTKNASLRRAFQ